MKEALDRLEAMVEKVVEHLSKRRIYVSETDKIRRRAMDFINESMRGVDIGCGGDKLFKTSIGIDGRALPGVDVVADVECLSLGFSETGFDYVYSSHCLEHVKYPYSVLSQWLKLLRTGGAIVLYLPHRDHYTVHNPEHLHTFIQANIEWMLEDLGCKIVCSEMDLGYDRYSFFIVGIKGT